MQYILKPKWKKCVCVETQWAHNDEPKRNAINSEYYRYEEFEVTLAEGVDVEVLKTWEEFDLDDEETFASYEWLDTSPVSGDVAYSDWEVSNACTDEEREAIEEGDIWNLEDWDTTESYTKINSECEITPAS